MLRRLSPPRLSNDSNFCSVNCIFQVLLNDIDCLAMIEKLNDDDPLKLITIKFTTITRGNRSIDLGKFYEKFQPIIDAKKEEILMHPEENIDSIQMDPLHILEKILNSYAFLKNYFRNSDDQINYTQAISIDDNSISVQNGLNMRINENANEFTFAPECLCINVSRVIVEEQKLSCKRIQKCTLSKKSINPNKFIHYSPLGTNFDEYYIIYAMILHHNANINQGHFEVLLFINDEFYQCNDSHVTTYLKNEVSDSTLRKKNYIFFYKKCDEKPNDYDDKIMIIPPRKANDIDQFFIEENDSQEISKRNNSIGSNNDVFPVTALNRKTIPLFIPYDFQAEGKIISPEIIIDDLALRQYELKNKIENKEIKLDLHKKFKYLNGFLDIAPGEPPVNEYSTSSPCYEYTQKILEVFTDIIINLVYKSDSISNGEINANLTAQQLNIEFDSPLELQIKDIGENLYNLFKDYDNKKLRIDKTKIEKDIVDYLIDWIYYDFDEDENIIPEHKNDHLHEQFESEIPNQYYDWKTRISEYGIEKILDEIKKKANKKVRIDSSEKLDKIREKLWKDFLSKKSSIKSKTKFIKNWVKSRDVAVKEGAQYISEKRAYSILNKFIKNGDIIKTKEKTGAPPKFSDEARLCLLATVMDFPNLTDGQRADFLNKFGPCKEKNVSARLINKELNKMNITIKKPCFSDPQRNSIGFRIARYIWSKIMIEITDQKSALFVFIDEAGVQRSQPSTSRGFVSVRPLTEGTTKSNNIATILVAVIPGYGSISRWFKGSVTNNEYAQFLREISYILRTHICNKSTQIITIQDNASIHKTKEVREMAKKCNLNLFYIVPYSPHLNEVAENYFSQLKFACIFDNEFAGRDDYSEGINGITKFQFLNEEEIMYRWNEMTKKKYSGISALSIYQGWISILRECIQGKPLTGQKFERSENTDAKISFQCYRKNEIY